MSAQTAQGRNPEELDARARHLAQQDELATDVIEECRVQLLLKFRFLDLALWKMPLEPLRIGMTYPLATNAKTTYMDPPRVIARFQESFEEAVRDYLHLVLHCVFRHPFVAEKAHREAWDLTLDIVAENAAMELCATRFPSSDDTDRQGALDEVRMVAGSLLPGKVFEFIRGLAEAPDGQRYKGIPKARLADWRALFERDDHGAWPVYADANHKTDEGAERGTGDDAEQPETQDDLVETEHLEDTDTSPQDSTPQAAPDGATEQDDAEALDASPESQADKADEGESSAEPPEERDLEQDRKAEREWEQVAKEIEMNLESFSREWGEEAGGLMTALALSNRRKYDYTDFLRQFMTITEHIKLDMEAFDYTYYMYGMEVYGNMPLVEPLEYKEAESIHDFVIVIDTSESVRGDLVRGFVEHTFNVLRESADFATEVNVHIIQADSKVQSDLAIHDVRDIDRLMASFTVRGFGGTDFRPAFEHVARLRRRGELTGLKGLIYFTDGLGTFPEKAPDFDAAFVFLDDGARDLPPVPPWAMKLSIDERDISRMKGDQ